jgi:ribulose-5-phosphate 4-epimerase/fuculose-1-phosphate aldolase
MLSPMTHHVMQDQLVGELVAGGHALHRAGLVTAFGHVSCRTAGNQWLITPPVPLGRLGVGSNFAELDIDADELPVGVPREAWIHVAIAGRRPEVAAICRAQPPTATALASAGVPIVPLHGQGAFLGPQVPVFDDSILVRDRHRADALADRLGQAPALLMRGNGAVTVGATLGEAVARMWVLEASARMNATAAAAGTPVALPDHEQDAWRAVSTEILGRIWADLHDPLD